MAHFSLSSVLSFSLFSLSPERRLDMTTLLLTGALNHNSINQSVMVIDTFTRIYKKRQNLVKSVLKAITVKYN